MEAEEKIGGFTAGELQVASFWVRHRDVLFRALYTALITLSLLSWGYVMFGVVDAYILSYPRESRFTREIALNQQRLAALESDRPRDVASGNVSVFQGTD